MEEVRVARVIPDVTGLDKQFDYLVPAALATHVAAGAQVRVPLHGRRVGGWVVAVGRPDPAVPVDRLLPVAGVVRRRPAAGRDRPRPLGGAALGRPIACARSWSRASPPRLVRTPAAAAANDRRHR